ncbi:MAG: hypothetical protein FJW56_01785 [Actinobacteria bacterium]|nr:hypothetical protein [Actinomycetota bacterium]
MVNKTEALNILFNNTFIKTDQNKPYPKELTDMLETLEYLNHNLIRGKLRGEFIHLDDLVRLARRYYKELGKLESSTFNNIMKIGLLNIYNYKPLQFLTGSLKQHVEWINRITSELSKDERGKKMLELIGIDKLPYAYNAAKSKKFDELNNYKKTMVINELASQDGFDLAFALKYYELADRNLDKELTTKIRKDIKEKKKELRAFYRVNKGKDIIEKVRELDKWFDIYKSSLSSSYKEYADTEMLSTFIHDGSMHQFIRNGLANNVKGLIELRRRKEELKLKGLPNDKIVNKIEEVREEIRQKYYDLVHDYKSTDLFKWGFGLYSVSSKVLIDIMNKYSQVMAGKVSVENGNEIIDYVRGRELGRHSKMLPQPEYMAGLLMTELSPDPKFKVNRIRMAEEFKTHPELKEAYDTLRTWLIKKPYDAGVLTKLFAGWTTKTAAGDIEFARPYIASNKELIDFTNTLKKIMEAENKGGIPIKVTDYFRISPREELAIHDLTILKKKVPILTAAFEGVKTPDGNALMTEVYQIRSTSQKNSDVFNKANEHAENMKQVVKDKFIYSPGSIIFDQINNNYNNLASRLYNYAAVFMERNNGFRRSERDGEITLKEVDPLYREKYELIKFELEKELADKSLIKIPYINKSITRREYFDLILKEAEQINKDNFETHLVNKSNEDLFEKSYLQYGKLYDKDGYIDIDIAKKMLTANMFNKNIYLGMNYLNKIQFWNSVYKSKIEPLKFFNMYLRNEVMDYIPKNKLSELIEDPTFHKLMSNIISERPLDRIAANFYKRFNNNNLENLPFSDISNSDRNWYLTNIWKLEPNAYKDIGHYQFNKYWHHTNHDKKIVRKWEEEYLNKLIKEGKITDPEVLDLMMFKYNELEGNEGTNSLRDIIFTNEITQENVENKRLKLAQAEHRGDKSLPGWSLDRDILLNYQLKAIDKYHKLYSYLIADINIQNFVKRRAMGEYTEDWRDFLYNDAMTSIGLPTLFPKEWMERKSLKIGNSPYLVFTDQFWKDKFEPIFNKYFGHKSPIVSKLGQLTPEQLSKLSKAHINRIKQIEDMDFVHKIVRLSQLEAKWSFLSLLTHTKYPIYNIVGGLENTLANIGSLSMYRAKNKSWLRENIFLGWEQKKIEEFVDQHYGADQMLKNEVPYMKIFQSGKFREFMSDTFNFLTKNKYDESKIREIASKHNISNALFDAVAYPARKSEMFLRRNAWLSHYINARNMLNATGLSMEYDHPWLLEIANKGVSATQFLYNNASRAPFNRTPMGKIYGRFQHWAWKSMGFRNQVFKTIGELGYRPGTAEFERAKRFMTMDLFILALATIFPASLFDSTLAPPLNYLQNFSEFIFGDEKERDRAFYGYLPYPANILQPISPPALRPLPTVFKFILDGDLDKVGYDAVSWMPFGRMTRSVVRSYESPNMMIDNFTGLPVVKVSRMKREAREDEKKGVVKYQQPLPSAISGIF